MDFAQLGIKLDTNDLEKGLRQLKQLQPTGAGAAAAADKLSKSLSRTALAQERLAISTAKANKASAMEAIASGKLSKAKIVEQRAIIKAADAQIKASTAKAAHIKKLRDEIALQKQVTAATNAATAATAKNNSQLVGVANRFTGGGGGGRGFGVANDPANDLAPNRFNTANIAAQFQDIGVTAAMGMNPMTIALQQGTQLSAILNSMSGSPLKGLAAAFTSIINPVSLLSISIVALIAAGIQFIDWAEVAKSSAMALADGIRFLADNLETAAAGVGALITVLTVLNARLVVTKVLAFGSAILSAGKALFAAAGAAAVFAAANAPLLIGLVAVAAAAGAVKLGLDGMFGEKVKGDLKEFFSFLEPVKELLNDAADSMTNFGSSIDGKTDDLEKNKNAYEDMRTSLQNQIQLLHVEAAAYDLSRRNAELLRLEVEQMQSAASNDITLTVEQRGELGRLNEEYLDMTDRVEQLNQAYDLVRDTGKGFFQDMRKDLQNGASAWESFGNAVTNALNRIIDKFFEASLDMVFDNLSGGPSMGTDGGFIGGIADFLFNAKGNAFSSKGVEEYAKGGTFTNSVVSSPTMFTFANGGKFGVMGEAGPEAVMPLRRGSDGSLGVQMVGGMGGGSPVTVNVINNSGAQTRTESRQTSNGKEIDVIIDDMVASKIGSTGTASNRAVQDANNRPLIRRG